MARRRARVVVGLVGAVLSGALVAGACGDKKGALMLAVTTDMKAPQDVNAVAIAISVNGAIKHSFIGRVTPQGEVLLPATLAIAQPDDASATVRIRVIAFQDRKPRVLRDVRTTVPRDGRIASLPIRLNFVNLGSTKSGPAPEGAIPAPLPGTGDPNASGGGGGPSGSPPELDFFGQFAPDCKDIENETFIDGECKDSYVDSSALPDFDPAVVGVSTDPTNCFEIAKCLAKATRVDQHEEGGGEGPVLDRGSCTLQIGAADPARVNFAFVTPDTGECIQPGQCYVPIDRGPSGWTVQDGRVQFPPFACRLLGKGLRLYQTTNACDAKQESSAICASKPGDFRPPQVAITVKGTFVDTYHPSDTAPTILRPRDLTRDITLEVLFPSADGHLLAPKPLVGLADGTFSGSFVPEAAGSAYVHVRTATDDYYVVTTASNALELGAHYQGRPDVQSGGQGTSLSLALDGLSPTGTGDELFLTCTGVADSFQTSLVEGGMTSADVVLDLNGHNLVDGTKGDAVIALQSHVTDAGQYRVRAATTVGTLPSYTQATGGKTQVPASGRFTMRAMKPAEMGSVTFDWKRSQFQALRADVHPQAVAQNQFVGVYAEPFGGLTYGTSYSDLVVVSSGPETTDMASQQVSYGNPFPASWGPLSFARSQFFVSVTAPGAKATDVPAFIEAYAPAAATVDGRPYVSPVRNIRLDGVAFATASSVPPSPKVEWDAPAVGPATMYVLDVLRPENKAGETNVAIVTSIFTSERQVRIPAGVMEVGGSYLVRVVSVRDGRPDPVSAPQRFAIPFGRARAYTNTFSVAQ